LYRACNRREKNIDVVNYLISLGADYNNRNTIGETPLHGACRHGNLELVKLLVNSGADTTITNDSNRIAFTYLPNDITSEDILKECSPMNIKEPYEF